MATMSEDVLKNFLIFLYLFSLLIQHGSTGHLRIKRQADDPGPHDNRGNSPGLPRPPMGLQQLPSKIEPRVEGPVTAPIKTDVWKGDATTKTSGSFPTASADNTKLPNINSGTKAGNAPGKTDGNAAQYTYGNGGSTGNAPGQPDSNRPPADSVPIGPDSNRPPTSNPPSQPEQPQNNAGNGVPGQPDSNVPQNTYGNGAPGGNAPGLPDSSAPQNTYGNGAPGGNAPGQPDSNVPQNTYGNGAPGGNAPGQPDSSVPQNTYGNGAPASNVPGQPDSNAPQNTDGNGAPGQPDGSAPQNNYGNGAEDYKDEEDEDDYDENEWNKAGGEVGAADAKTEKKPAPSKPKPITLSKQPVSPSSGSFMTYFVLAIVIVVVGYLVYHNKQKIMGFVIEGRNSNNGRRRPSSSEYKKLSNVEEAMPSLDQSTATKNFIY